MFFTNQLVSWNLAKIIFKFNNYSTFQISDYIPEGISVRKNEGIIGYTQAISILNKFTTSEATTTLNEIYQTHFKSTDNETFQRNIRFLVETAKDYVPEVYLYNNSEEADKKLREVMKKGDMIYFKGSRSMNVSQIVDKIREDFE